MQDLSGRLALLTPTLIDPERISANKDWSTHLALCEAAAIDCGVAVAHAVRLGISFSSSTTVRGVNLAQNGLSKVTYGKLGGCL